MREAAAEDSAEGAGRIKRRREHLDLLRGLLGRRDHETFPLLQHRRWRNGSPRLVQADESRRRREGRGGRVEEAGDQRHGGVRVFWERHSGSEFCSVVGKKERRRENGSGEKLVLWRR